MIKFFRSIRQRFISENKMTKYLVYAAGEILLVVLGILIALSINNWNESRKEQILQKQLIALMVSDLDEKKKEILNDIKDTEKMIERAQITIDTWDNMAKIDTNFLKFNLLRLGNNIMFQNEQSPLYSGLSNTDLWKQLPDSLNTQINRVYRIHFMYLKVAIDKAAEQATHCKLHFLVPNNLVGLDKSTEYFKERVTLVDEEFISYMILLRDTCRGVNYLQKSAVSGITDLIENLESYIKSAK